MTSAQVVEMSVNVTLTLIMTSAQVVKMSVNVTLNNPSQNYTPDDHIKYLCTYYMTPGFKPFTDLPLSQFFKCCSNCLKRLVTLLEKRNF